MHDDPTGGRNAYFAALDRAAADLAGAIDCVKAEQDSGRISLAEACVERVTLLERHLGRLEALRREHFGDPSWLP